MNVEKIKAKRKGGKHNEFMEKFKQNSKNSLVYIVASCRNNDVNLTVRFVEKQKSIKNVINVFKIKSILKASILWFLRELVGEFRKLSNLFPRLDEFGEMFCPKMSSNFR